MNDILKYIPFAGEDWVQITSIALAILLGAIPNFCPIKTKGNKKFTILGKILIPIFIVTLFFSIISTIATISFNNDLKFSTNKLIVSADSTIYSLNDLRTKTKLILDSLDLLQANSKIISNNLSYQSVLQGKIRNSSDSILLNLKAEQRINVQNDSIKLKNVIFKLSGKTVETSFLSRVKNSIDSLNRINIYKNYLKETLVLMESQNLNFALLLNNDLQDVWKLCIRSINETLFKIDGYGLKDINELAQHVNTLNRFFRNLPAAYEEEMETGHKKIKALSDFFNKD